MANSFAGEPGLRERKKRDVTARLQAAARELMWDRGYDAVTTKEIAAMADVGEATLFRYFSTKLDLFLMVYSEEFSKTIGVCTKRELKLGGSQSKDPEYYVERILDNYRDLSKLYVRYPELAYTYVRESFGSYSEDEHAGLVQSDEWFQLLEVIISEGQSARVLVAVDATTVVQNCHALYVHEVLRSHARGLSSTDLPRRLVHRLEVLLAPLMILPGQWLSRLSST